ncbi:hypothetical protein BKA62DRAFT_637975 [Auriculariales sp. MPI-PUGE-AT-0066]|nr:hypothetical protein BKA62DRAFT_637975 [Auriculariales sp. MPI-PUGE-AT-0066]
MKVRCLHPLAFTGHRALCHARIAPYALKFIRFQSTATSKPSQGVVLYQSPTEKPVRFLKSFCVSGTGITLLAAPFMLLAESSLPTVARVSGLGMALFGTASTAAFVARFFSSYVLSARRAPEGYIVFRTADLFLRPRLTSVYDPAFLVRSTRPNAKFELTQRVEGAQAGEPGAEETVAQTTDHTGRVLGRWVVRWQAGGVGECRAEGKILQDFQLAEELLTEPLSPALAPPT